MRKVPNTHDKPRPRDLSKQAYLSILLGEQSILNCRRGLPNMSNIGMCGPKGYGFLASVW